MKRLLILTILINLNWISYSQSKFEPALLINNNSDTIIGSGYLTSKQKYCVFRRYNQESSDTIYPNEIKAFRIIEGKYFVSKKIKQKEKDKTEWIFLEFIVEGKINLYAFEKSRRYFLEKEGEDLVELEHEKGEIKKIYGKSYNIKDKRYIGFLRAYMEDTPELYSEIDKLDGLNQNELINLSKKYHQLTCDEYECVLYTKSRQWYYKIESSVGVNHHNNYYSPMVGGILHLYRPKKNPYFHIIFGLNYRDRAFTQKDSIVIESKTYAQGNINSREYGFEVPVGFFHSFGLGKFKPTLAYGFKLSYFPKSYFQLGGIYRISEKLEFSLSGSIDGILINLVSQSESSFNNQLGYSLNFGLILKN